MELSTLQNDSLPVVKPGGTRQVNSLPVAFMVLQVYHSQRHTMASVNALSPTKHDSKPLYNKVTNLLMGIKPGVN